MRTSRAKVSNLLLTLSILSALVVSARDGMAAAKLESQSSLINLTR